MKWQQAVRKASQNPFAAVKVVATLGIGRYYSLRYCALNRRVVIGRNFRIHGGWVVRGRAC